MNIIKIIFLLIATEYAIISQCVGEERWSVKTLQDKERKDINFKAYNTTVSDLKNETKFPYISVGDNDKRLELEKYTVIVKCKILKFKKVYGDNDLHIVITPVDDKSIRMVVEVPDPECSNVKNSEYVSYFKKAREFVKSHRIPGSGKNGWYKVVNKIYTIYGVLYRDQRHGKQPDQEPNFIEIHPVLTIN
jgi:hypothetical protein